MFAQELLDLCGHIDVFTASFMAPLRTVDDVLAPDVLARLRDIFLRIPLTNIVSEAAFAAAHTRRAACHGNDTSAPTVSSNHLLSASRAALLTTSGARCAEPVADPQPKQRTAWQAFVTAGRATKSLAVLGEDQCYGKELRQGHRELYDIGFGSWFCRRFVPASSFICNTDSNTNT